MPPAWNALLGYVRGGGGFFGIHAASDALYGSAAYHELVGGTFAGHPALQTATFVDPSNPATASLPSRWQHADELYEFTANPRGSVRVLLRVDEAAYQGGGERTTHRVVPRLREGALVLTVLAHPIEAWTEPVFLAHIRGALRIAARRVSATCTPN
jgi:type 1 glutamine amidotransferase